MITRGDTPVLQTNTAASPTLDDMQVHDMHVQVGNGEAVHAARSRPGGHVPTLESCPPSGESRDALASLPPVCVAQPARQAQVLGRLQELASKPLDCLRPHHVAARVLVYDEARPLVVPAALTRVAPPGSLVANAHRPAQRHGWPQCLLTTLTHMLSPSHRLASDR
jgi:hypothetical protein